MARMKLDEAVDDVIAQAMAADERIVVIGEDVHMLRPGLYTQFGASRVLPAPISEAAFVGAAVGAAMAGLRPVVEVMMVDFIAVAMDSVLNHMAKVEGFSGGTWTCPLVVRAACGAGYGDGGQHGQSLWGMLAGIPGLSVVVPSTPADAAGLMRTAIEHDGPVFFMEPKLLTEGWLEFLGRGGREMLEFDVPKAGAEGVVPDPLPAVPLGQAVVRRTGRDLTILSLAVGVHRALEACAELTASGISCEVIDLRSVRPLDTACVVQSVRKTGRMLVVDEDYTHFGLSGELAATALEAGLRPAYGRVGVDDTLPFARDREAQALPNVERIVAAAKALCG
ncbi:MAG: pyruvate dehydrogenase [Deltaproteobacteria bacterium]|nr:MAG: pyruvate dehydrogenase [Deltaproteobacteria bacterium]